MKKRYAKILLTAALCCTAIGSPAHAQSREEAADIHMNRLYHKAQRAEIANEPELSQIVNNFIYADVRQQVKVLSPARQELLTLAALTATNSFEEIPLHVTGALNAGATPEQIHETVLHITPYVGIGRVKAALKQVYLGFADNNIKFTAPQAGTVTDATRYDKGLELQIGVGGNRIIDMIKNAPADTKHINDFLAANCFGDFYTRKILNMQERELTTFTALAALGGADSQVRGHANANIRVGNTRQQLLDAITVALPYMGYPRTLNALAAINAVAPAQEVK